MRQSLLQLARQSVRLSALASKTTPAASVGATSLVRNYSAAPTEKEEAKVEVPLKLFSSAGRYASALYVSATKKGKLIEVEEDLEYVRDAYKTLPKFEQYLNDPTIPKSEKTKGILSILDELKCNEVTKSFFGVLAENGRANETDKIIECMDALMREARGEVLAVVTSAEPFTEKERQQVQARLEEAVPKGGKLTINYGVDSSLVAGFIIELGDKYIDMSLSNRIKKLEASVKTNMGNLPFGESTIELGKEDYTKMSDEEFWSK